MTAAEFDPAQSLVQAFEDGSAFGSADGLSKPWPGAAFPQPRFDPVDVADLQKHPADLLRSAVFGLIKLPPHMRPATCQNQSLALPVAGVGWIGGIAVALHRAAEVGGQDVVQAGGAAAGCPGKAHVGPWPFAGPQVALFGLAVAGAYTDFQKGCQKKGCTFIRKSDP